MNAERSVSATYAVDPTLFTPVQFHARALLGYSVNGICAWFIKHLGVSIAQQVSEHCQSMVVVGCEIDYIRPFDFFEVDEFTAILEKVRVRQSSSLLEFFQVFTAGGHEFARVVTRWKIVRLEGDAALSAASGNMSESLLKRFKSVELDSLPIRRILPLKVVEIETVGQLYVQGSYNQTLHRHQCEVADQWAFHELTALTAQMRERVVLSASSSEYPMGEILGRPIKQITMELSCPVFLFEEMLLETNVYLLEAQWVFLHRIYNLDRAKALAATVIESF